MLAIIAIGHALTFICIESGDTFTLLSGANQLKAASFIVNVVIVDFRNGQLLGYVGLGWASNIMRQRQQQQLHGLYNNNCNKELLTEIASVASSCCFELLFLLHLLHKIMPRWHLSPVMAAACNVMRPAQRQQWPRHQGRQLSCNLFINVSCILYQMYLRFNEELKIPLKAPKCIQVFALTLQLIVRRVLIDFCMCVHGCMCVCGCVCGWVSGRPAS